jgi:predicted XRE-type DNA-binding protein
MSKKQHVRAPIERGSGNVFADVGVANPQEALAKAKLAVQIAQAIEAANLTQNEAADRLGIDQPKISNIVRGRLAGFTIDRLMRLLTALGQDVQIQVGPSKKHQLHGELCVACC